MTNPPHPSRVIKHGTLPAAPAAHAPAPAAGAAPSVRLVRAGNVVKAIRVDCLCGRSLEIECTLETAAPAGAGGSQ